MLVNSTVTTIDDIAWCENVNPLAKDVTLLSDPSVDTHIFIEPCKEALLQD